ncbi:GNAT family protein [Novosphingobium sp. SG720]|uniref:GNAT family N-acetyltransferase n=1 Tax=Novosphingobium sp. SG720 TaxID=2586998 RepID=UPI00144795DF|nr:GNAT family protein [Novosphingobium sp. SG720]NKJ43306.1 RimJ/RimL family protein N-acetyltransferase [Novosphingobium sp. SG720]
MFIRSERLFLRPGWPEDWAELFGLIDDEAVVRHLVRVPWPYHPDDARAYAARAQSGLYPHFFVTLPGAEGAQLIGCVGLMPDDHDPDGAPRLGYWIARAHWGRGFATEAARAVLALAATLGHRRVAARHFLDNPASGRVLAKLGFRSTGEIRPGASPAREGVAPTLGYALDLDPPGNCDGDRRSMVPVPRAA